MKVIKARYGTCDENSIDVTDIVNRMVERNCQKIYVCNSLFSQDPVPGNFKMLFIQWEDGFTNIYREFENAIIRHVWDGTCAVVPPFLPIQKRNLIYHVAPFTASKDIWKRNIQQLKAFGDSRINGTRVVGIVVDNGMDSAQEVLDEFGDFRIDHLLISRNNRMKGESETLMPALRLIASTSSDECFYYAHTKGVQWKGKNWEFSTGEWSECMYRCLFEHSDRVDTKLLTYPVVGAFKSHICLDSWSPIELGEYVHWSSYGWMFNGSFFVCRHDCLFGNKNWEVKLEDKYLIERFPSFFFRNDEAGTIFPGMNGSYKTMRDFLALYPYYRADNWTKTDWRKDLALACLF
jgi:hypothetical protein